MHTFKTISIAISILIFLTACGTTMHSRSSMELQSNQASAETIRILIKSAKLVLEVEEPRVIVSEIKELVNGVSGYIDTIYDRDKKQISLIAKIPEKSLDSFVATVSSMGELTFKSLNAEDVTEEMIDIDAKLTNLKVLRDRFRKLLDKAKNVSDVLKIERELSRVQSEIDSIEARKKSLKNQVTFSRVDIALNKKIVYGPLGYLGKGVYWFVKKLFVIK